MRRFTLIAVPYAWLLVLFLVPFVIVFQDQSVRYSTGHSALHTYA